jgi:hypothetical protein
MLKEDQMCSRHERFMLGQTVAEIQECINEGSIVVMNIADFRSDAILISNNTLTTIKLPELSASDAKSSPGSRSYGVDPRRLHTSQHAQRQRITQRDCRMK